MSGGDAGILKWVTIFDSKEKAEGKFGDVVIPEVPDEEEDMEHMNGAGEGAAKGSKNKKRLSVERIYQKKTQLEHILLRPDTYIGSIESVSQQMWVYDDLTETMVQREITFVPGLYKIFDEILVNASDNKQRDPKMNCIKIDIDPEANKIKVWNNGKGIPIVHHKTENMYVPTLIFGHLLTSSNFNDDQKKVTGGRNGYGAKLCNVFSNKFIVETQCNEYKKAFKQTWQDNMAKSSEAKIVPSKGDDYTCVTFHPDLKRFKMDTLTKDMVDLFTRRAYDIAAASRGVKVMLNGKRLPVKNFKDYIELYTKGKTDDNGVPLKLVHEVINDRWEVGVALSDKGFQQVSFVNSIATTKGGRHTDYVTDQLVTKLIEVVKKKEKKGGIVIKPFQVRSHLWVFVNCLIENPTFDSQTKENMTLQAKSFGSKCLLTEKFINQANKCGIVESIQSWMKFKAQEKMNKKCSSSKHSKLKGVPKLDDANDAGTKNSMDCTLILTEGDSAKTLAVAGLGVVGRDRYGVFPLRGKVLNVREATPKQIMENAEINNIIKILGLRYKEKYTEPESLKTLRYGRLMIMTDQDQDGSHIKGLLINFIHNNWPNLLKHNFIEEFITPIVKVTKGKNERSFYSLPEFESWKEETDNWHTYKVKYYKGLGTSTSKEAKEYFSEMARHRIPFKYAGPEDDAAIILAFSRKKIEERKEWLTNWMEERKRRAQLELPELYLYGKETKKISFNEFVNRELILFSNMDNERSIPCMVDGFKPGQRKILFACFKRNITKEFKVAQLAGSVAEHSAYHHGEQSLMGTIITLAQNYVGSNNINLLMPCGQFGTRLHGGKDAASPRYIFTMLSPLARHLFNIRDDPLLKALYDDNLRIEPEWYMPILPMVLINGAQGIGTGWSTNIPNYNPREIAQNIDRMIDGLETRPMVPWFRNFKGTIEQIDEHRYIVNGEINIVDDTTVEILELPIRVWTQSYKEQVLEPMLQGTDKTPATITDYKEYHTDTTVKFVVKMTADKLARAEDEGLHKFFKLQCTIATSCMVLFDDKGCIKRYASVDDIMRDFFAVRLDFYQRRKDYLEGMLSAESLRLDNQARFIMEKIEGTITIENKPKRELIKMLVQRGYDSDPVKSWKQAQNKLQALENNADDDNENEEDASGPDFNYILGMALWCLSKEKKEELLKQRDAKSEELYQLKKKRPNDLWRDDLKGFLEELDKVEQQEKEDEKVEIAVKVQGGKGRPKFKKQAIEATLASPYGRRVEPRIDPALRAKAEAAAKKKKKKEEKEEAALLNFDDDEGDDEFGSPSLASRLAGAIKKADIKGKKEPKEPKAAKEPKEKKPRAKKGSGGTPKKGKKKNPWSDSEEEEMSNVSGGSDFEGSFRESAAAAARERAPRRAAATAPAKYKYSDEDSNPFSDDDEKPNGRLSDVSEDERKPIKPAAKPTRIDDSDSDVVSKASSPPPSPPSRSSPPPKHSFPASPVMMADSDDDDISKKPPLKKRILGEKVADNPAKKPAARKAAARKLPKKPAAPKRKKVDGSDSDFSLDEELIRPTKKAAPAAPRKADSDISDNDLSDDDSPVKKPAARKPAPKKYVNSDDSDMDYSEKPAPTKAAPPTTVNLDSDISDFGLSDDDDKPITKAPPKKAAPKKKPAPKKPAMSDDSDPGLSDSEMVPVKKQPAKKKAPAKPKKKKESDASDFSDSEFAPKKKAKKAKTTAKKKKMSSDEGSDMEEYVPKATARGAGRAKQPVKYNFGESDDDSDY